MKSVILNDKQVEQKITRIAHQILERNFDEKEVVLAGIYDQGYILAELLLEKLKMITSFKVTLVGITLDKQAPTQSDISLNVDVNSLKNKVVIIMDDVSNTGRTMAYSIKPFLSTPIKKIETAVLVNRSHVQFPISINYSGYELATTINDHVQVEFKPSKKTVFLV